VPVVADVAFVGVAIVGVALVLCVTADVNAAPITNTVTITITLELVIDM
jgi:hypothetical protein